MKYASALIAAMALLVGVAEPVSADGGGQGVAGTGVEFQLGEAESCLSNVAECAEEIAKEFAACVIDQGVDMECVQKVVDRLPGVGYCVSPGFLYELVSVAYIAYPVVVDDRARRFGIFLAAEDARYQVFGALPC